MNKFRQPFFSTIFTLSSHHPYNLPDEYVNVFKGGSKPIHKTIQYSDYSLKQFFKTVSKTPWFNNTIFVLTADHTSAEIQFQEYNSAWGYFSIPIIFYQPSGPLDNIRPEIIQQIDIMPTLLGLLHYDKPYISFGRDVFSIGEPFAFNYLNGTYQIFMDDYLLQYDGLKSIGLYNFKLDRHTSKNLVDDLPDIVSKMELRVRAFIQQYSDRMITNNLTIEGSQTE